jgi:hypothetical protein
MWKSGSVSPWQAKTLLVSRHAEQVCAQVKLHSATYQLYSADEHLHLSHCFPNFVLEVRAQFISTKLPTIELQ